MKKKTMFVMSCFLMLACVLGCSSKKSKFEESAGNLKAEIEHVYNVFDACHHSSPQTVAESWCSANSSWKNKEKTMLGGGYYVETNNKNFCINRIDMDEHLYTASVKSGTTYEEVCQSLSSILGSPDSTGTYHDGGKYSTWKKGDGVEITAYTDYLDISTCVYFSY